MPVQVVDVGAGLEPWRSRPSLRMRLAIETVTEELVSSQTSSGTPEISIAPPKTNSDRPNRRLAPVREEKTFSVTITAATAAIQTRFIIPISTRTVMRPQQQPRQ